MKITNGDAYRIDVPGAVVQGGTIEATTIGDAPAGDGSGSYGRKGGEWAPVTSTNDVRSITQLGEWTEVAPDAELNGACVWRPQIGAVEPLFGVFGGSNILKTSPGGLRWTIGAGLGVGATVVGATWASDGFFYATGIATGGVQRSTDLAGWAVMDVLGGTDYYAAKEGEPGEIVIAGGNPAGEIWTTVDGVIWIDQSQVGSPQLFGLGYGAGVWHVVGAAGQIYRATNLATWLPIASGTGAILKGVEYGNGRWVAVGFGGVALYSTDDGITWLPAIDVGGVNDFWAIHWSETHQLFLASGDEASGLGVLAVSRDGEVWTKVRPRASDYLRCIVEADDMLLAVGGSGAIMRTPHSFSLPS